ncbi:MAG: hypothetical protein KBS64_06815 [Treponema sp.]|nr:hypothetical protein [Candidatus Treponema equi]
MITLDQVLLLQEKVESAVEKISSMTDRIKQLETENDALRSKCAELTKAVSEKTELVSTLETAQDKIEESILRTIDRLDSVEDSILGSDGGQTSVEESTEEPFVYEQEETESGLLHKSEQVEAQQTAVEQPQVFEDTPAEEENSKEQEALQNAFTTDTPAPSALDGQFDIF